MFIFSARPVWSWPVTVQVPAAGGFTEQTFTAVYQLVPDDQARALAIADDTGTALLAEALIGWDGVTDANKAEIPFNAPTRDALLQIVYVRNAVFEGYRASLAGAPRKN